MEKDEKEGRVRRRKEKRKHLQSRTILFRFDAYVTNSLKKKKQNLLYRIIVTTATNDLYSSWVSVSVVQELTAMSEIFSLVLRTHIKRPQLPISPVLWNLRLFSGLLGICVHFRCDMHQCTHKKK